MTETKIHNRVLKRIKFQRFKLLIFLIFVACLLNFLIIANPGYYSHDELGFGFFSQGFTGERTLSTIDWFSFFNVQAPQYRPITFNIWLFSSHFLYSYPPLFHLFLVLLYLIPAVLLYVLVMETSDDKKLAIISCLIYLLLPSTTFAIAWVGTIAEALWVIFSLLVFIVCYKYQHNKLIHILNGNLIATQITIGILFILSMMSKETAITIPGFLLLHILFVNRSRIFIYSFFNTLLISFVYMVLRFQSLLGSNVSSAYSPATSNVFKNLIGYLIYPFAWNHFISYPQIHFNWNFLIPLFLFLLSIIIIFGWNIRQNNKLLLIFYLLGWVAPLAPILLIPIWSPHYLYASGILMSIVLGSVINSSKLIFKLPIMFLVFILFIHSLNIQLEYYHRGVLQSRILNSLYIQLKDRMNESRTIKVPNIYIKVTQESPAEDIIKRVIHPDVTNIYDLDISRSLRQVRSPEANASDDNYIFLEFNKDGYLIKAQDEFKRAVGSKEQSILSLPHTVKFSQVNPFIVLDGFGQKEEWGRWTEGEKASINYGNNLPHNFTIHLEGFAFGPNTNEEIAVVVGSQRKTFRLGDTPQSIEVSFSGTTNTNEIFFYIPYPTSPKEIGKGEDERKLGIALTTLTIK